jgi:hypothetical protein
MVMQMMSILSRSLPTAPELHQDRGTRQFASGMPRLVRVCLEATHILSIPSRSRLVVPGLHQGLMIRQIAPGMSRLVKPLQAPLSPTMAEFYQLAVRALSVVSAYEVHNRPKFAEDGHVRTA